MCESSSAAPPESVQVVRDPASGLDGVIVLHSTRLGPAAGGCRLWRYADGAEMARDFLEGNGRGHCWLNPLNQLGVIPAKAGIQHARCWGSILDEAARSADAGFPPSRE